VKIILDPEMCTGHGRCYALAPHVFTSDDLGRCEIVQVEPDAEHEHAARIAVASCPEVALSIAE